MDDIKVESEPLEATEPEPEPAPKSNFRPQHTYTLGNLRECYEKYINGKTRRKDDVDTFIAAALLSILERLDS